MSVVHVMKWLCGSIVLSLVLAWGNSAQAQCGLGGFNGYRGGYSAGYGGYGYHAFAPQIPSTSFYAPSWGGVHATYHPGTFVPHRNHYHYVPGHYHAGHAW